MVSTGNLPILPKRLGAIEPYVYNLSKNLAEKNFVDIIGVGQGKEISGNLAIHTLPIAKKHNSLSKFIDNRIATYAPFNILVLKKIFDLHSKNPIDILHIHEVYTGFAASISKISLGIPFVCSLHNEVRKVLPIKSCNRFIAVSEYVKKFLIDEHKINQNKISILNPAIDVKIHNSKSHEDAKKELGLKNKKLILFVGRKCPEKGPLILIKALNNVIKKYPDTICYLIGPDYSFGLNINSYSKYLQNAIKELGLANNVFLKGFVSNFELQLYYLASDIFVCPSVWNEPFGIVLLEALSYGKPVIASKVGGIPEIIEDKRTGLLVNPNNPRELGDAILFLLRNPLLAQSLGLNGFREVEKKYDFKTVSNICLEIYQDVISNKYS